MERQKKVHFIGIGGIGMSALARYFKSAKWAVSGSDAASSPITQALGKEAIRVKIGHKKANIGPGTALVVISQAIRADNPELKEARHLAAKNALIILTYPEAVAELTRRYQTIAVAGAHGKSTSTALAALILIRGGLDPTVIVGTNIKEFGNGSTHGKNFRRGRSDYFVLEADEFGNAFSRYSPTIAVITNIDREHLDVYKNLANVKKAFLGFMRNTANGGALILNRDDKNLWSLRREVSKLEKEKNLRVIWHSNRGTTAKKIRKVIKIPGEHNVADAIGAYKAGRVLGISHKKILEAIGAYHGAWRRMQYRGKFHGAPVFDDYAHHPTEIKATLQAFRDKYPKKCILCVFQPHQAKRLAALFPEFKRAFDGAHETILLPIYKVTGRDEKPSKLDSLALTKSIWRSQPKKLVLYILEPRNLKRIILAMPTSPSSKVIVMMGAGDIVNYTDSLIS